MTRINLVPVEELTDQHLMAEYRELPRIPNALVKLISSHGPDKILEDIPETYRLGKGHVKFFYDKGGFLLRRYADIVDELVLRGFKLTNPDREHVFTIYRGIVHRECGIGDYFVQDYVPTEEALVLSRARIAEKIAMKPHWYKRYGKPIS